MKYPTTVPIPHATPTASPFSVVQSPTVDQRTEAVLAKYPTTVPLLSATQEPHTHSTTTVGLGVNDGKPPHVKLGV